MCHRQFPAYGSRTYMSPHGYGTLGFSMPTAIGAKIAQPDKEVIAVVGDGGYQFTMEELAVAIQHEVTVPIVIFNDSTYTAVKRGMDARRSTSASISSIPITSSWPMPTASPASLRVMARNSRPASARRSVAPARQSSIRRSPPPARPRKKGEPHPRPLSFAPAKERGDSRAVS